MTNFSFLKLLDEAILPFIILAGTRFLGVFLIALIFPVEFSFGGTSELVSLPLIKFGGSEDLYFANSFSWGLVGLILAGAFGYFLFRVLTFHGDFLHPKEATRIHRQNLEFLIIDSHEAFHQGIAWVLAALVAITLAAIDFLSGVLAATAFGLVFGIGTLLVLVFWLGTTKSSLLERKKV